jgi:ATP-dependent protease ClpP protease subunit
MREMYLLDKREDSLIGYANAFSFYKELHELEMKNSQPIVIHGHTTGGNWEDGMAMFDAIKYSPCSVYMIGHGCLYSMGTVLIQAAKKRYLMPNCSFMVHLGSMTFESEFQTAASTMEFYQTSTDFMLDLYSEKCYKGSFFKEKQMDQKKTRDFIYKKLKDKTDWYMTATEAVYYGFADKVLSKTEYINLRRLGKLVNRDGKV